MLGIFDGKQERSLRVVESLPALAVVAASSQEGYTIDVVVKVAAVQLEKLHEKDTEVLFRVDVVSVDLGVHLSLSASRLADVANSWLPRQDSVVFPVQKGSDMADCCSPVRRI